MTQTRSNRSRRRRSAGIRTLLRKVLLNLPMIVAVLALITPLEDAHTPGIEFRHTDGGGAYAASLQWCPPIIASLFTPPVAKRRGPSKGLRALQAREVRAQLLPGLPEEAPPPDAPPPPLVVDLPPPPTIDPPFVPDDLLPPLPPPPPVIGGLLPPDVLVPEPPPWLLMGLSLVGLIAAQQLRRSRPKA
jgi:hypothetical protein